MGKRSLGKDSQPSGWKPWKPPAASERTKVWQGTGFGSKTLWDWLQLLAIMAVPVLSPTRRIRSCLEIPRAMSEARLPIFGPSNRLLTGLAMPPSCPCRD
jgi:hypothetical protein